MVQFPRGFDRASCWGPVQAAQLSASRSVQQQLTEDCRNLQFWGASSSELTLQRQKVARKKSMDCLFLVIRSGPSIWHRYTLPPHYFPSDLTVPFILFFCPVLIPPPPAALAAEMQPVPDGFTSRQPHVTFGVPSRPSPLAVTHILNITLCRKNKNRGTPACGFEDPGNLWPPSMEWGWGLKKI